MIEGPACCNWKDYGFRKISKVVFSKLDYSRNVIVVELVVYDRIQENLLLFEIEKRTGGEAIRTLWEVNHMEETSWRQKSRVLWLKEGDRNTNSFLEWQMPLEESTTLVRL